ncbi:MAG: DUF429 domain-containing protein [Candidatus Pacearchaeota archaeon]
MFFIGIDLAWSTRNKTGIAILKGNKDKAKLLSIALVFSDKEILKYIRKRVGNKKALVAVDAPLIVPNKQGRRIADSLTSNLFRKYNAGAYPANRERLSQWDGKIRGEELAKLLEEEGFIHDPYIKKFENTRKFFEVYPHPAMVVIFDLKKILQYKPKPNRNYKFRWLELKKYQSHLKMLEKRKPSLILPKEIINKKVKKLKANKLKNYEDLLDAIFCAYIAYYV